jgi:serine phosphatase RsbU (regulator of sigma subunit)
MIREGSLDAVRALRLFFRIATPVFFFLAFSFSISPDGVAWIMWRDNPALAITLVGLSALMGLGWFLSARRLRVLYTTDIEAVTLPSKIPETNPYNIWKTMSLRRRLGLAFAVFLSFATIGPLTTLMNVPAGHIRPIQMLIATLASGGFAACIILFANRPVMLVASLGICFAIVEFNTNLSDWLSPSSSTIVRQDTVDIRDERVLVGVAGIALLSSSYVMFIILLTGEGKDRLRLQTEVNIAQRIQHSLVPASGLTTSWCIAGGKTVSATEVGGDFFDFLELRDGRLLVGAADVAGHGVGAGILSAMTKSALRSQAGHDPSPAILLGHLNRTLVQLVDRHMFVTFACLVADNTTQKVRIATAGHPPVLLLRNGHLVREVRTRSLALGMDAGAVFSELEIPFERGDVFLLYTDGVVEAASRRGEQFGTSRLSAAITSTGDRSPDALCKGILQEVSRFAGTSSLKDDATVVAVCMRSGSA